MLETLWFDMHENINMAIPYLLVCKNRICTTTTTTNKQTKKRKKRKKKKRQFLSIVLEVTATLILPAFTLVMFTPLSSFKYGVRHYRLWTDIFVSIQ